MRSAIFAALATFLAAIGIAGGSLALAEAESPKPYPLIVSIKEPELVLPEPSIPAPPIITVEDTTRSEPEQSAVELPHFETASKAAPTIASESEVAPQPEPEPEPEQPVSTGMGKGVEQWRSLVTAHFGADLADTALCLMEHESGGNPNAQNPNSGASGLMQVMPDWAGEFGFSKTDLFIPDVNLSISRALYDDGGWKHWTPYLRGACH